MAFLRFTRDKRGIENFFLVQATTNRRGKVRPRVLYWFRTPPDVKVGREPFDAEVRRALEAQNPDVTFDWRAIVETPIPSADADKWRERRRAERAAKHAARAEEEAAGAPDDAETESAASASAAPAEPDLAAAPDEAAPAAVSPARAERPSSPARRTASGGAGAATRGAAAPAPQPYRRRRPVPNLPGD